MLLIITVRNNPGQTQLFILISLLLYHVTSVIDVSTTYVNITVDNAFLPTSTDEVDKLLFSESTYSDSDFEQVNVRSLA